MTCIVGIIDRNNSTVVIGGDSCGSTDFTKSPRKDTKVFKVGEFVIGCTSSFRMINLLKFSFHPPEVDKEIYEYMCTSFINEMRKCFKDGGYIAIKDGVEYGGSFLVGYKDRLFCIEGDLQVGELTLDYNAVGCGEEVAKGVLFALDGSDRDPRTKITMAIKAAETFCLGVEGPCVFEQT